jgi:prolyl-tRNA synthetase
MPVKVFNQTSGRDEEKVFGENTNRCFESIEVPAIEDFEKLRAQLQQLQCQSDELAQFQQGDALALKNMAARMLDREHAEQVVAELKLAIADTTVFTNALYAALDDYEQRIGTANAKVHHEVAALQQQSHASAAAAQEQLDTFQSKTTAIAQSQSSMQAELKVMLTLAQQAQADIQVKADALVGELRQLQAWSAKMNQGGFWARLLWLLRGIATKT